ncbi:MAG: ComEC family DNA internalization-related competence protein [Betaproteobacteria bacterium]|nr:ComEC family DNA internalization-related competence protein [Betaproteobacteria bacterium]
MRLSALHGQRNPAGTDLERLALQSDWVARGRAPLSHSRQLEALAMHPLAWVHRTRQVVRDAIRRASAEPGSMPRAMAVIEALVIGSGEGLDPEQWDAFNRTGVGHLLSISGSHVTMFAGFAAFFARLLCCFWGNCIHLAGRIWIAGATDLRHGAGDRRDEPQWPAACPAGCSLLRGGDGLLD